jgi:hypothetical protein
MDSRRRFSIPTKVASQDTGIGFTQLLKDNGIAIRINGRRCRQDTAFHKRLLESIKYEDVYLRPYETTSAGRSGIGRYLNFTTAAGHTVHMTPARQTHCCYLHRPTLYLAYLATREPGLALTVVLLIPATCRPTRLLPPQAFHGSTDAESKSTVSRLLLKSQSPAHSGPRQPR